MKAALQRFHDEVAARVVARGTQRGEWMGVPPTDRQVEVGAYPRTIRTGRLEWCATAVATLPRRAYSIPRRPWEPMTIKS